MKPTNMLPIDLKIKIITIITVVLHLMNIFTQRARLLLCVKEFDQQFRIVFIKCGTSEKKYISRSSSAYGFFVL